MVFLPLPQPNFAFLECALPSVNQRPHDWSAGKGGGVISTYLLLFSIQYLQGSIYAILAQVPGLVRGKVTQLPQQSGQVHVLVVVEVAEPPATKLLYYGQITCRTDSFRCCNYNGKPHRKSEYV
jgi:hypothetical protein